MPALQKPPPLGAVDHGRLEDMQNKILSVAITFVLLTGCQAGNPIAPNPYADLPDELLTPDVEAIDVAQALPPAEHPELETGVTLTWQRGGYQWQARLISTAGGYETWEHLDGSWQWTQADFISPLVAWSGPSDSGTRTNDGDMSSLFPLKVGKEARVSYTGVSANSPDGFDGERLCRVLDQENVTVPAGTFDTYKILCLNGRNINYPWRYQYYYYAPELGVPVYVFDKPRNMVEPRVSELLAIDRSLASAE